MEPDPKTCNNCLDWHQHCGAECCRTIVLQLKDPSSIKQGSVFRFKERDPSMRWYYRLHGARISREWVEIIINEFKVVGNRLVITAQCEALTDDLRCSEYTTGRRPRICKRLGPDDLSPEGVFVTPNCLYAHKKALLDELGDHQ